MKTLVSTLGCLLGLVHGSVDYYLEHPPRQPKAEIADYVEKHGILVPRRFPSFEAAVASGVDFILRSEHPDEYAGAAGIRKSHVLTRERLGRGQTARLFAGLDADASYSYWQYIPGYNRAVIADSAIPGRYHITTTWNGETPGEVLQNYTMVEKGVVVASESSPCPKQDFIELIRIYEKVRRLSRFVSRHCPVMEIQTGFDGQQYFLQYHRTRDAAPSTFRLTRGPEEGEIEAEFVRGATAPEGETLSLHVWPQFEPYQPVAFEEAGVNPPYAAEFAELMSRRRRLILIDSTWTRAATHLGHHEPRSSLFNPAISVVVPLGKIIPTKGETQTKIRVISDGRRAYLKRMDVQAP